MLGMSDAYDRVDETLRGMEGFSTGTIHGKLGVRAGNTGELIFQDVRVPKANRLGEENQGWTVAKYLLEFERGGGSAPGSPARGCW